MTAVPDRFTGQAALVTGASSGIGRAVALRLAGEGAALVLGAAEDDRLKRVAEECRALDAAVVELPGDLADQHYARSLVLACDDAHGSIDVVVNSAFWSQDGDVATVEVDGWQRTLDVTLTAALVLTQEAVPRMSRKGHGSIVYVISQRAFAAGHAAAAYESAKAGLLGLCRSTAVDYGPYGVRANCVSPGLILSPRVRDWHDAVPARGKAMSRVIPLGRPGEPAEVASVIAFLASAEASYVNGAVWAVDGGALAGLPENAALDLAESGDV